MIQCPRGTRDFLPDEMERRRFYENRLRHTAQTFGFREVETPIFEDAELFVLRSGPNVLKEIYAFKDKGDRDIALRPEMTAPAIRMFVNGMSNDPKPIKIFYFGQCFRYERPQSGRYREFFQFGAELIGSATPETDAEVICMAAAMIGGLGLKGYRIRIGHIGVLRQAIADAGVPRERTAEVLQKLDKKLYDEARPLLEGMGVDPDAIDSIFALTETVGGTEVLSKVPGEAGDYLRQVISYMHAMGVDNFDIDLGVVRGLDYYTGMVFEAEAGSMLASGAPEQPPASRPVSTAATRCFFSQWSTLPYAPCLSVTAERASTESMLSLFCSTRCISPIETPWFSRATGASDSFEIVSVTATR